MQITADNFTFFASLIKQAKIIAVFLKEADLDKAAAASFIVENCIAMGKQAYIVCDQKLPKELAFINDRVKDKIPAKKLVISFNWKKNSVEKVSYSLDGDDFNFIIVPYSKKINIEDIKFSYQGQDPDLFISLGLKSLEQIESPENNYFENKTIINIDKDQDNQLFGSLNIVRPKADSLCAVVAELYKEANLPCRRETAGLLLIGLRSATDNFSKVADPASFEAAAFCTRIKEEKFPAARISSGPASISSEWLAPKVFKSKEHPN